MQLFVSFKRREQLRDVTGDIWEARTLEWSTSSPPPDYNFAFTPVVHDTDAWWHMKQNGYARPQQGFIPIHMPKNTAAVPPAASITSSAPLRSPPTRASSGPSSRPMKKVKPNR